MLLHDGGGGSLHKPQKTTTSAPASSLSVPSSRPSRKGYSQSTLEKSSSHHSYGSANAADNDRRQASHGGSHKRSDANAASFREADQISLEKYAQQKPEIDAENRRIIQQIRDDRARQQASKLEEKKGLFDRTTGWVGDKFSDGAELVDKTADTTWDATKTAGNYAWEHKGAIGHGALDAVGVVDPFGVADGANAVWYLAEGDKTNAAISAAGMIPYVGDAAKIGKYGYKGYKAVKAGESAYKTISKTDKTKTYITYTFRDAEGNVHYVGRASGRGTPDEVLEQRMAKRHRIAKENDHLKPKVEAVQGNGRANVGAEDVLYSRHQTSKLGDKNGSNTVKVIVGRGGKEREIKINNGANRGGHKLLNRLSPIGNGNPAAKRYITAYAQDLRTPTPL